MLVLVWDWALTVAGCLFHFKEELFLHILFEQLLSLSLWVDGGDVGVLELRSWWKKKRRELGWEDTVLFDLRKVVPVYTRWSIWWSYVLSILGPVTRVWSWRLHCIIYTYIWYCFCCPITLWWQRGGATKSEIHRTIHTIACLMRSLSSILNIIARVNIVRSAATVFVLSYHHSRRNFECSYLLPWTTRPV